jgi:DNA-binding XRE family transcriptional regulator
VTAVQELQVVPVAASVRTHQRNRIIAELLGDRPVSGGRKAGASVRGGFALRVGEPRAAASPVRSRLRHLRECAGLPQSELADLVGVQPPTVSGWENGHHAPTMRAQRRLAELFKVTPAELDLVDGRFGPGSR